MSPRAVPLTAYATYHAGRPVYRRSARGGTLVLCPAGHLVTYIPRERWAGSIAEARASDPTYTVECIGRLKEQTQ